MRIYVSGPMSGVKDMNFPAFNDAAAKLRALGHEVVNPAELGEHDDWQWSDYLKRDIVELLKCEVILMLPNWADSRGASLEKYVAEKLGLRVVLHIFDFERAHLDAMYAQKVAA